MNNVYLDIFGTASRRHSARLVIEHLETTGWPTQQQGSLFWYNDGRGRYELRVEYEGEPERFAITGFTLVMGGYDFIEYGFVAVQRGVLRQDARSAITEVLMRLGRRVKAEERRRRA